MGTEVGFIGLGVMGYPMAGWLSKAGHSVTVYNRTGMVGERWMTEFSGSIANTAGGAAKNADMVFICVGNDDDVRSVAFGEDGVLASLKIDLMCLQTIPIKRISRLVQYAQIIGFYILLNLKTIKFPTKSLLKWLMLKNN